MKTARILTIVLFALGVIFSLAKVCKAAPLGTAFTYQGHLYDTNSIANGLYDFQFKLFDDPNVVIGQQIGSDVNQPDVDVIDGHFTVELDFESGVFDGYARWLQIGVRPSDTADPFTTLSPRQEITPVPYALALPGLWTQQNTTSTNLVGGYSGNMITVGVVGATIGGGGKSALGNKVTDDYSTVAGGVNNKAGDDAGTTSDALCATVGGGSDNTASSGWATVSGGSDNTAGGNIATIGGGSSNTASGSNATIGGGLFNNASDDYATVGGGYQNTASNNQATVGGGYQNTASGYFATVPGGRDNVAGGDHSFAAGHGANANHDGTFVWSDSTGADFASTANNQFLIRASGGVGIGTNSPDGFQLAVNGFAAKPGGGSWSVFSDRRLKKNIEPLAGALDRMLQLKGVSFEYSNSDHFSYVECEQMGMIAQEVEKVFPDWVDRSAGYKTVTYRGFEAITVEAFRQLRKEKDAEITELKERMAKMEAAISKLIRSNDGGQL